METNDDIPIGARRTAKPGEIILLTAEINYTNVHFSNGRKTIVALSLKELEKRFAGCESFFRVHRSYIVNLHYVKQYRSCGSEGFVRMKYDYKAAVSRRKRPAFLKLLSSLNSSHVFD